MRVRNIQIRNFNRNSVNRRSKHVWKLHHLHAEVEFDIWRTVLQRYQPVNTFGAAKQRNQTRLSPNRDFGGDFTNLRSISDELDSISKTVKAVNEHSPANKGRAVPDAL